MFLQSDFAYFIFNLESSKSLMIEHLACLASVEFEVGMTEVNNADTCNEQQQPRVVTLALGLERIIAEFVPVWFVMNVVLLFEGMAMRVG